MADELAAWIFELIRVATLLELRIPTDLSAPLVDEKAELPAIIVTPSSPVFESEFFIAFLAPPPSPTFSQRLASMMPSLPSLHSYLPSQIQLPATPFKSSYDEGRSSFSFTRAVVCCQDNFQNPFTSCE